MNLIGTLAKVALGVVVARGVGKLIVGATSGGGLLGGLNGAGGQTSAGSPSQSPSGVGGIGDILGGALSGGGGQASGQQGGLGGLFESLGGGQQKGGLGPMLDKALKGQAHAAPEPHHNDQAELMLRAMISAAKSDGQIDREEQEAIIKNIGEVTPEEIEFVRKEMARPLDVDALVRSVPRGMEQQVYLMSLLGMTLDQQSEAQYLDRLASGLGISHEMSNAIHAKLGVPVLYGDGRRA